MLGLPPAPGHQGLALAQDVGVGEPVLALQRPAQLAVLVVGGGQPIGVAPPRHGGDARRDEGSAIEDRCVAGGEHGLERGHLVSLHVEEHEVRPIGPGIEGDLPQHVVLHAVQGGDQEETEADGDGGGGSRTGQTCKSL